MRLDPRTAALALLVLVVAQAPRLRAEERPAIRLEYTVSAPADRCPAEGEFRDMVAARLGYDAFSETAERRVVAAVEGEEESLTGRIRTDDGAERVLEGATSRCAELVQSMALAVALFIDPLASPSPSPPPPPSPAAVESEPAPAPIGRAQPPSTEGAQGPEPEPPESAAEEEPADEAPSARRAVRVEATVGLTAGVGLTPGASLGGLAQVGLVVGAFSLAVEGRVDGRVPPRGDHLKAYVYVGGLVPCYRLSFLRVCLVVTAGAFQGRATYVDEPETVTTFFSAIGARLVGQLRATPWLKLQAFATLSVPFLRTALLVDGESEWEAPPVFGLFGLNASFDLV